MIILCCTNIGIEEQSFFEEVLPTLVGTLFGGIISIVLAVLLFRAENKRNKEVREKQEEDSIKAKRKEVDRLWYLNVLVNPNLERIEVFFKDIRSVSIETRTLLLQAKSGTVENYNKIKAERRKIFKEEVRKFEFDFIKLIQSNSPDVSESLMEWLRSFDDIISKYFDKVVSSDLDVDDLLLRLSVSKTEFYKILNYPVKNE